MANKKKKTKKRRLRVGRLITLVGLVVVLGGGVIYGGYRLWPVLKPVISQIGNNEKTSPLNTISHAKDVEEIKSKNALDQVSVSGFSDSELKDCFYSKDLDDKLKERLTNMGWTESNIAPDQLSYVRVLYRDFDNNTVVGELMVNKDIASIVEDVFFDLYIHQYQIGKMILPDAYGTRISESFADNNTVALCFGLTEDNQADFHARGYAIDINPLYNPLIKDNGSSLSVFPMEGQLYLDRTTKYNHFINDTDYAVTAFKNAGFNWRGGVPGLNDYKHFEWGNIPAAQAVTPSETESGGEETADNPDAVIEDPGYVEDPGYEEEVPDYGDVEGIDPSYPIAPMDPLPTDPIEEDPGYYEDPNTGEIYYE